MHRFVIITALLVIMIGCGSAVSEGETEQHTLPSGFTGVYQIENRFGPYCNGDRCRLIRARYDDGRSIAMFNPRVPPEDESQPCLLPLMANGTKHLFAVGTHRELTELHRDFFAAMKAEGAPGMDRFFAERLRHPEASIALTLSKRR